VADLTIVGAALRNIGIRSGAAMILMVACRGRCAIVMREPAPGLMEGGHNQDREPEKNRAAYA